MDNDPSDKSVIPLFNEIISHHTTSSHNKKDKCHQTHIWHLPEEQPHAAPPNCLFCHVEFANFFEWHSHMVSFIHTRPSPSKAEAEKKHIEVEITCKYCHQDILLATAKEHRCFLAEVTRLKAIINDYNNLYCPLICVLCKNVKIFPSQALLQIHIVTKHSPMKYPQRCTLCNAKFRTSNLNVHEVHAMDIHGPELSLLYWRLQENSTMKKSKSDMKFPCALSYYSSQYSKDSRVCPHAINDIFHLTIHTLCFHGFVPCTSVLHQPTQPTESVTQSFHPMESVTCRNCCLVFPSELHMAQHIGSTHTMELMLRKDFIIKKKLFAKKIAIHRTCFYCMTIYSTTFELQVHLMVKHSNSNYEKCGMCGKRFLEFDNTENSKISLNMQWHIIQYHETCHYRQFQRFNLTGEFNENFFDPPLLYESEIHFAEEFRKKKTFHPPVIFTSDQIAFLKKLGQINYQNQISWEMMLK